MSEDSLVDPSPLQNIQKRLDFCLQFSQLVGEAGGRN
jgi:hypothetical protein